MNQGTPSEIERENTTKKEGRGNLLPNQKQDENATLLLKYFLFGRYSYKKSEKKNEKSLTL